MRIFTKFTTVLAMILMSAMAIAEAPIETGTFNNKAIYGYDTVAYFTQGKPVKGKQEYVHQWRGADWYFANEQHKKMFIEDPVKYAPQYGGYCAYAMSKGRFVGVDEEAFTIYGGKLYLNYSKGVMKDWRADKDGFISLADVAYKEETGF